jgi:hypothetical protein
MIKIPIGHQRYPKQAVTSIPFFHSRNSHLSFIKLGGLETELDICREPAYTGDLSLTLKPSRNKSDMIIVFIEKIKQHTRNYAKRQITWFKRYAQ